MERLTSTRDRNIISENMSIERQYPHEGIYPQGTSTANRREYPGDSSDDNRSYRGQRYSNERGRPPDEERYPNRDRRPPRRRGSQDDGIPPNRHGGHSSRGGPPDGGGPPDDGGPPDGNGGPPRCPDRRGPPDRR